MEYFQVIASQPHNTKQKRPFGENAETAYYLSAVTPASLQALASLLRSAIRLVGAIAKSEIRIFQPAEKTRNA